MEKKPEDENEGIFVDDKVMEILRESLKHKLKKERKYNKKSFGGILKATLQEFLTCGKLLGYDLDGNVVEITFFGNKMEDSALQNLFVQKFGEFIQSKANIVDDF
jgi:hypothetical protein